MAENDIYNSQVKYENFKKNLELFGVKPELRNIKNNSKAKYYCKNKKRKRPGRRRDNKAFQRQGIHKR